MATGPDDLAVQRVSFIRTALLRPLRVSSPRQAKALLRDRGGITVVSRPVSMS
jgi:hypothetical protein